MDAYANKSGKTPPRRATLRLALLLLPTCPEGESIQTETEDVDMDGFFCYIKKVFPPGERLRFLLKLPSASSSFGGGGMVYVQGLVEVIHVSARDWNGDYGISCQVKRYSVLANGNSRSHEEMIQSFLASCRWQWTEES